jgi:hypothetical protein
MINLTQMKMKHINQMNLRYMITLNQIKMILKRVMTLNTIKKVNNHKMIKINSKLI